VEPQEKLSADNFFSIIPEWLLFADISAQAVRLYGVLRRYADRDGSCFPSRKRLANDLRMESTKPVDKALKELQSIGAITIEHRYTEQGDLQSNLYTVLSMPLGSDEKLPTSILFGPHGRDRKEATVATENSQIMRANLKESQENEKPLYPAAVETLCYLLAGLMEQNGVKKVTISGKWLADMDKLMRIDERTVEQIENAIRWSQSDSFWSANIHSPAALRKQYEKMRLQAIRQRGNGVSVVRDYINNLKDTND
jgi:Helix-turn-helix domain